MGDLEDFAESSGYYGDDPETMVGLVLSRDDSQNNLKVAETKPIKYSKLKKIGFNNFKPFGNKIQSFSQKPITLIYGPNSIGKSSVIHMLSYVQYFLKTNEFNFNSTDILGDNINLGGFESFVHKRDKNRSININFNIDDCSTELIKFLNLEYIDYLSTLSKNDLMEIIKNHDEYISSNLSSKEVYDPEPYSEAALQNGDGHFDSDGDWISSDPISTARMTDDDIEIKAIKELLVPYHIKLAKYQYLEKNIEYNDYFNIDNIVFNEEQIVEIATDVIEIINQEKKYKDLLKSSKIPVKIELEIKYSNKFKKAYLRKVKYFIDNQFYDAIEAIELQTSNKEDFKIVAGASIVSYDTCNSECIDVDKSLENNGEFGSPQIFENAPFRCKNTLFEWPDTMGRDFHEVNKVLFDIYSKNRSMENIFDNNFSVLSLSYKEGYSKLIGLLNDLIKEENMQYIGPLRFYPERNETQKEFNKKGGVPSSEESWSLLKEDEELRKNLNKWLSDKKKLKSAYQIKYRKLYDIEASLDIFYSNSIAEIQKKLEEKLTIIKTFSIHKNWSDEDIIKLYKSEENKDLLKGIRFLGDKLDYISDLVYFSGLSRELQLKEIFVKYNVLEGLHYREELIFEDLINKTQISNRDLGLGISQVLPILIATNRQKDMTIAIEQPELHLHPAVQCEIADEFIRSYKENNNEFMIETHSEHLLLRIMKRMRHTAEERIEEGAFPLTPNDVCLLYVNTDGKSTWIEELELDEDGSLLDPWPNGFFEEGHKERFD